MKTFFVDRFNEKTWNCWIPFPQTEETAWCNRLCWTPRLCPHLVRSAPCILPILSFWLDLTSSRKTTRSWNSSKSGWDSNITHMASSTPASNWKLPFSLETVPRCFEVIWDVSSLLQFHTLWQTFRRVTHALSVAPTTSDTEETWRNNEESNIPSIKINQDESHCSCSLFSKWWSFSPEWRQNTNTTSVETLSSLSQFVDQMCLVIQRLHRFTTRIRLFATSLRWNQIMWHILCLRDKIETGLKKKKTL